MGLIGIGFLMGTIASVAVIALCKTEQGEPRKKEITTDEMKQVINYYYHFGHPSPYEQDVLQATMEFLEGSGNEEEVLQG